MAKRGATSQITREGGGLDEEDENESKATEDGTPKQAPEPFVRKIRPLPSSRLGSASNSPVPTPPASGTLSSTPAFGGGFSFGSSASTSAPAAPVFGSSSTASKPSAGFSFGPSSVANPFAASAGSTTPSAAAPASTVKIPSNPFASISLPKSKPAGSSFSFNLSPSTSTPPTNPFGLNPAPAKPLSNPFGSSSSTTPSTFGAASTTTPISKPPAFSFSSASNQPFTGTAVQSSAPSSPAIAPAPTISLPWGPTTSGTLPKLPIDKPSAIDRLRPASPTESTIVEAPTSPRPRPSKVVPLTAGSTSPDGSKPSSLSSTVAYPFPSAPGLTAAPSQSPAPSSSLSFSTATTKDTTSDPVSTENGVDKKLVDHYLSQRGLNHSLLVLLQSLVEKDPFRDLSKTLSDLAGSYAVNRSEIDQTDAAAQAASISSASTQKTEAPREEAKATLSAPVVPPTFASSGGFSFGGAKVSSTNGASSSSSSSASPSGFPTSSFGSSSSPSTGGFSFGGASTAASSTPAGATKPSGFTFGGKPLNTGTGAGTTTGGFSFGSAPAVNLSAGSESSAKKVSTSSSGAGSIVKSVLAAEDSERASKEEAAKKETEKKDAPKGGLFSFTSATTPSSSPFSFGAPSRTESPSTTTAAAAAAATTTGAVPYPPSFQRLPSGTPNFSFGAASPGGKARTPSSSFSFGSSSAPAPALTTGSGPVFPSPLSVGGSATSAAADSSSAPALPSGGGGGGEATGGDEEPPAPTIPSDPTLMEKGVGEEDEETTWEGKSSINKFDDGKWVKVGVGLIRVKKGGESGDKGRVLGRTEGTGNVLINFACHADLTPRIQQGKSIMLQGFDKTKPMQYLLRVKDASTAQALLDALEERVQAGKA
ncbi:1 domain protein [Phaffia rhodozyma]|uniref:1 domain protein n=1 Tax=Phaffia rhodozyma TaxID=264483 RepID=A0A0F7SSN5_PHARH|nr:1 domain protein [Phaffia rhodozyma]